MTDNIAPWQAELLAELEEIDFSQIAKLQALAHKNSVLHGFWEDEEKILSLMALDFPKELQAKVRGAFVSQKVALIHDEASERHEEARSGHPGHETYYTVKNASGPVKVDAEERAEALNNGVPEREFKPEGQGAEVADVIIREMDLAEWDDIDIATRMKEKMKHNIFREPKHGRAY
jgi:hypothetical protein